MVHTCSICARICQLTCVATGSPGGAVGLWLALRPRAVALGVRAGPGRRPVAYRHARRAWAHGGSWVGPPRQPALGPPRPLPAGAAPRPRQNRVAPHATGPAVARQARAADLTPRAGFGVRKTSSSRVCPLFSPWLDWVVGFGKKGPSRPITARHAGHVPVTVDIDLDPC